MSFARFSSSDVYVFEHVGGFIQCCGCSLVDPEDGEDFGFVDLKTPRKAIKHLKKHKKAGENIGSAIKNIKRTYKDLDATIDPYELDLAVNEKIKKKLREAYESNFLGLGIDSYSSETVTIEISKRFVNGSPSHWSVKVIDHNGSYVGEATGPSFASMVDSACELISGDDNEVYSVHNPWVDFNSNKQ